MYRWRSVSLHPPFILWTEGAQLLNEDPPPPGTERLHWTEFTVAPRHTHSYFCPRKRTPMYYTNSVHWEWQADFTTNPPWAPEIYESVWFPITVMRVFDAEKIDRLKMVNDETLARYLHFDFIVERRLRQLRPIGCLIDGSKPPEKRSKGNFGDLLGPEHHSFCLFCNHDQDKLWPTHETQHLQSIGKWLYRQARTNCLPKE